MWLENNLEATVLKFCGRRSRHLLTLLGVAILGLVTGGSALAQSAGKTTEDLPAGAMQAKATTACAECHEARIILQQRLSKAAWTKEVDKMIKWGAVVDASDRDALIDYLSTNFSPEKPPYQPPRTAARIAKTSR
jgi:mono/diheme cytochrome c family protein